MIDAEPSQGEEEKKRQKRGGKGMMKAKKKAEKEKKICLSRAPRGKKKFVTVITGLKTFGNFLIFFFFFFSSITIFPNKILDIMCLLCIPTT